jgi:hypothetical protein
MLLLLLNCRRVGAAENGRSNDYAGRGYLRNTQDFSVVAEVHNYVVAYTNWGRFDSF